MTPKWHRTLQGQKYPIDVLLVFSSPKFLSFRSTTIFQSQANDSEWLHLLLLHYKVICTRYLQLCATSVTVPQFQSISLYCQLLCRFSPFWKCSEWPKQSWMLWRQMYPIYMYMYVILILQSLKVQPVSLDDQSFSSYPDHFETSARNDRKITLNSTRPKVL